MGDNEALRDSITGLHLGRGEREPLESCSALLPVARGDGEDRPRDGRMAWLRDAGSVCLGLLEVGCKVLLREAHSPLGGTAVAAGHRFFGGQPVGLWGGYTEGGRRRGRLGHSETLGGGPDVQRIGQSLTHAQRPSLDSCWRPPYINPLVCTFSTPPLYRAPTYTAATPSTALSAHFPPPRLSPPYRL